MNVQKRHVNTSSIPGVHNYTWEGKVGKRGSVNAHVFDEKQQVYMYLSDCLLLFLVGKLIARDSERWHFKLQDDLLV